MLYSLLEPTSDSAPWIEPGLPRALADLSEMQRTVVMLVHAFGWSYRETAHLLEVTLGTVQRHMERGMEKLPAHGVVKGLDGTHPLINHSDTDFAWGYVGAGPSTLARCIVIDTLGKEARCKRCSSGGIDPDSGREQATCGACGGDGWSDVVDMAAPVVRDQLLAPLEQDAWLNITSEGVMDIILQVSLETL